MILFVGIAMYLNTNGKKEFGQSKQFYSNIVLYEELRNNTTNMKQKIVLNMYMH
jgi:hypothetical protein